MPIADAFEPNFKVNKDEIESWLVESLKSTVECFKFPTDWWPGDCRPDDPTQTDAKQPRTAQSDATAWAISFFLEAAESIREKDNVIIYCSDGKSQKNREAFGGFYNYVGEKQVMLDFVAGCISEPQPILITGESEMTDSQSVDDFCVGGGYLWDFFKLLVVPSPVRLFVARVAGSSTATATARMQLLAQNMMEMRTRYAGSLSLHSARFAVVIIPSNVAILDETLILWSSPEGTLQCEKISKEATGNLPIHRRRFGK